MGFEKLIDLVVQFLEFFRFCTIVDCYERGVCLRFGKFHKVLEPGLRFLVPFYIDNPIVERVVPRLAELVTQTLVTLDGKNVAAGVIVQFQISDIEKALLEVNEVWEAVQDACQATLAEHVQAESYDALRTESFAKALTTECRIQGERFGIEILSVRLHELALVRTYRLIGSK